MTEWLGPDGSRPLVDIRWSCMGGERWGLVVLSTLTQEAVVHSGEGLSFFLLPLTGRVSSESPRVLLGE